MQKKLFFCCSSGSGCRDAILRELGESIASAGGYITEKAVGADGSLLGLDLLPAAAAAVEGFSGARFLDFSVSPPKTDNEVFRVEAVRLLQEAPYYPFSLLDSIGGFELVIPQYREALAAFLSSSVPCVGILRPFEEAELMRGFLGLGERCTAFAAKLYSALEADADTLLLDVPCELDANHITALRQWADAFTR
ncbi:MAG: hypothetical protein IJI06_05930 [Oscillospiraceae bacterium]|nr:hypothetical protein [Oscillospiraceae bacterium]